MGNGNIGVGKKTLTRHVGTPILEAEIGGSCELKTGKQHSKTEPRGTGSTMSLQRGDSGRGNYSVPQELLQLVGCRDLNARRKPWVRPRFIPVKQ